MEIEVPYKQDMWIECEKRLNMAYLLLKSPQMIDVIQKSGAYFFHGTNANALPNILKYGLNSVDKSNENNIVVTTGESWSRVDGKRSFVSLTDCLGVAITYANRNLNDNTSTNTLLNFGVIIGASMGNMKGLSVSSIKSCLPEIGVLENLPLSYIKFLAVPDDKVEFVKKLVGNKNIEVIPMDIKDSFLSTPFYIPGMRNSSYRRKVKRIRTNCQ